MQVVRKQGKFAPKTDILHALVDANRCGLKTEAGWFDYSSGRAAPSLAVAEILSSVAAASGIRQRLLNPQQIVEALLYPLINEGFLILEEGMAQKPSDIDVCYVHGLTLFFPLFV